MKRALLLALLLAGCGGSSPSTLAQPEDETLQRETRAGDLAFALERPEEAIARYQAALTRAQARDDVVAIGDLGYDLAVTELRADAPERALAVARETRAEFERRKLTPFPALLLAEATALYRLGRIEEADAAASRAQNGADAQTSARAIFLRGLMADQRGDSTALAAAIEALRPSDEPSLQADASELAARLALRRGDPGRARAEAEHAAALRQTAIDYRGLARALALAGESAKQSGDAAASAAFFLRAGQSAVAQHDTVSARPWLEAAVALANHQPVGDAAQALLRDLDRNPDRADAPRQAE
jgi:hypothetical protein